ncbi:MAG: fatty acid desaturase, partial [Sphingobacteriales bacterium]
MVALQSISDPQEVIITNNSFTKFWQKRLADARDIPFVKLSLQITVTLIPLAVLMYLPVNEYAWWFAAALYTYFNNFVFKGSFGLMLHCTSHRPFFKAPYKYLNHYLPWIIGPLFGQTPETYFSHHLGMHHSENNLEDDLSSTMLYQRDSFGDFMMYFASFFFMGLYYLIKYFDLRNRKKLRDKVIRGELVFFLFCLILSFVNWPATLVVFILPWFISRFIMMLGNWTQHAFIDFDEPENCYKNSITCINTPYNHKCWNDGYHINHHLKPALHWTQYPKHFIDN